ncbi:Phosphoglycolate phosphatase [subsurface metagenome]
MHTINAFLFDLDGTIWNSEPEIVNSLIQALSEVEIRQPTRKLILNQLRESGSPNRVLRQYHVSLSVYWRKYRINCENIELFFDNTHEIFKALIDRRRNIGFVTALKKEHTFKLLHKFDLLRYSDIVITPSDTYKRKPNPGPILEALKHINKTGKFNSAIYIGNQESDIIAAKRAGCISCLAAWGTHGNIKEEPDFIINSLEELIKFT